MRLIIREHPVLVDDFGERRSGTVQQDRVDRLGGDRGAEQRGESEKAFGLHRRVSSGQGQFRTRIALESALDWWPSRHLEALHDRGPQAYGRWGSAGTRRRR